MHPLSTTGSVQHVQTAITERRTSVFRNRTTGCVSDFLGPVLQGMHINSCPFCRRRGFNVRSGAALGCADEAWTSPACRGSVPWACCWCW